MRTLTGLLVGAAMFMSAGADAQFYSQASVSGTVLSCGPLGFMLQGPDGNYGIVVTSTTIVTDPWNTVVMSGPGNVVPGDYVTATGNPTSQWIMQASQVVELNAAPVTYGSHYYGVPGVVITPTSPVYPPTQWSVLP